MDKKGYLGGQKGQMAIIASNFTQKDGLLFIATQAKEKKIDHLHNDFIRRDKHNSSCNSQTKFAAALIQA